MPALVNYVSTAKTKIDSASLIEKTKEQHILYIIQEAAVLTRMGNISFDELRQVVNYARPFLSKDSLASQALGEILDKNALSELCAELIENEFLRKFFPNDCEMVEMSSPPNVGNLQLVPGQSKNIYVFCVDKLYLVNKNNNTCEPIEVKNIDVFKDQLKPTTENRLLTLVELKMISELTSHNPPAQFLKPINIDNLLNSFREDDFGRIILNTIFNEEDEGFEADVMSRIYVPMLPYVARDVSVSHSLNNFGLQLMSFDADEKVHKQKDSLLDTAKQTNMLNVIKTPTKFFACCDADGNGNWRLIEIKNENNVFDKLPFAQGAKINQNSELLTPQLMSELQKIHVQNKKTKTPCKDKIDFTEFTAETLAFIIDTFYFNNLVFFSKHTEVVPSSMKKGAHSLYNALLPLKARLEEFYQSEDIPVTFTNTETGKEESIRIGVSKILTIVVGIGENLNLLRSASVRFQKGITQKNVVRVVENEVTDDFLKDIGALTYNANVIDKLKAHNEKFKISPPLKLKQAKKLIADNFLGFSAIFFADPLIAGRFPAIASYLGELVLQQRYHAALEKELNLIIENNELKKVNKKLQMSEQQPSGMDVKKTIKQNRKLLEDILKDDLMKKKYPVLTGYLIDWKSGVKTYFNQFEQEVRNLNYILEKPIVKLCIDAIKKLEKPLVPMKNEDQPHQVETTPPPVTSRSLSEHPNKDTLDRELESRAKEKEAEIFELYAKMSVADLYIKTPTINKTPLHIYLTIDSLIGDLFKNDKIKPVIENKEQCKKSVEHLLSSLHEYYTDQFNYLSTQLQNKKLVEMTDLIVDVNTVISEKDILLNLQSMISYVLLIKRNELLKNSATNFCQILLEKIALSHQEKSSFTTQTCQLLACLTYCIIALSSGKEQITLLNKMKNLAGDNKDYLEELQKFNLSPYKLVDKVNSNTFVSSNVKGLLPEEKIVSSGSVFAKIKVGKWKSDPGLSSTQQPSSERRHGNH